jgi:hypothetical protein
MRSGQTSVRSLAAIGACLTALLVGSEAQASSVPADAATPAVRGHTYPGAPKDTPRCRKLLRQIERARDAENYDRLNKLARRYNRTCRVK